MPVSPGFVALYILELLPCVSGTDSEVSLRRLLQNGIVERDIGYQLLESAILLLQLLQTPGLLHPHTTVLFAPAVVSLLGDAKVHNTITLKHCRLSSAWQLPPTGGERIMARTDLLKLDLRLRLAPMRPKPRYKGPQVKWGNSRRGITALFSQFHRHSGSQLADTSIETNLWGTSFTEVMNRLPALRRSLTFCRDQTFLRNAVAGNTAPMNGYFENRCCGFTECGGGDHDTCQKRIWFVSTW